METNINECEGSFKLLRNTTNGKLEVSQSGSVRLLLFVERCEVRRYIESFILLDCWNTQVETFRILKHIRPNTYLAYILLKKFNMWTAQREAYVSISYLKDCSCLEEYPRNSEQSLGSWKCTFRHYVIISTVDYEAPTSGFVRMNFCQIAEFSEIEEKKDNIFLSLTSSVDAKTYEMLNSKVDLNANLLKDVPALSILYKEKTIQNSSIKFFDFERCACNIKSLKIALEEEKEDER